MYGDLQCCYSGIFISHIILWIIVKGIVCLVLPLFVVCIGPCTNILMPDLAFCGDNGSCKEEGLGLS